ncbi:MAG: hypothetical protein ACHQ0Y_13720 [Thermodesulfovibrionales bacterium]
MPRVQEPTATLSRARYRRQNDKTHYVRDRMCDNACKKIVLPYVKHQNRDAGT